MWGFHLIPLFDLIKTVRRGIDLKTHVLEKISFTGDTLIPNTGDDILVVTARQSEPGILWVNYLKTCFDKITKQRGRVPFK